MKKKYTRSKSIKKYKIIQFFNSFPELNDLKHFTLVISVLTFFHALIMEWYESVNNTVEEDIPINQNEEKPMQDKRIKKMNKRIRKTQAML